MLTLLLAAVVSSSPPMPAIQPADTACITANTENLPLDSRKSPLDSLTFQVDGKAVKVCYGRPSLRGRTMLGGEGVPFGEIWRTGANEPTMIHTTTPITVAGVDLEPGTYSLYTIPGEEEWTIILNRSYSQWGHESTYTPEVEAQEVGRGQAEVTATSSPVEKFTISAIPGDNGAMLVLEWGSTRVPIPVGT